MASHHWRPSSATTNSTAGLLEQSLLFYSRRHGTPLAKKIEYGRSDLRDSHRHCDRCCWTIKITTFICRFIKIRWLLKPVFIRVVRSRNCSHVCRSLLFTTRSQLYRSWSLKAGAGNHTMCKPTLKNSLIPGKERRCDLHKLIRLFSGSPLLSFAQSVMGVEYPLAGAIAQDWLDQEHLSEEARMKGCYIDPMAQVSISTNIGGSYSTVLWRRCLGIVSLMRSVLIQSVV